MPNGNEVSFPYHDLIRLLCLRISNGHIHGASCPQKSEWPALKTQKGYKVAVEGLCKMRFLVTVQYKSSVSPQFGGSVFHISLVIKVHGRQNRCLGDRVSQPERV